MDNDEKREAVICAIVLNEDMNLDEWIRYHIALGFSAIYIYDNSNEFDLCDLPSKYPDYYIHVLHIPGRVMQLTAYNHFIRTFGGLHKWCSFIDADEFIVLKKHSCITDMLREHCQDGALVLNWYMFGSSGKLFYEPEPVTKRFQLRARNIDKHVKTIVHLGSVVTMGIHECYVMRENCGVPHDTSGKPVIGAFNPDGQTDVAVIHHYNAKSFEEYGWKISRGRADNGDVRTINQFYEADKDANEVLDTSAWDFYREHCLEQNTNIKK
ncbi:hypothetical protein [Dishui Lake large algae virus 1]|nr:hypothetical protein [Dishui Lake large algae virus 1]